MHDALARICDRVRQNRAARQKELEAMTQKALCPADRLGCTFVAGVKVFDRVTGLEGEVVGGTRENLVVPAAE